MTLQELKKMVAQEYAIYKRQISEQGAPAGGPGGPGDPGADPKEPNIAVSDTDIDVDGGAEDNAEDTLKDIFDMLKDFFEGGDEDKGGDKDEDKGEGEEDKEEKTESKNSGYTPVKESKNRKKAKILNEIKSKKFKTRLQKLANIK